MPAKRRPVSKVSNQTIPKGLFRLPWDLLREIALNFDAMRIVSLSFSSKKMMRHLRGHRIPAQHCNITANSKGRVFVEIVVTPTDRVVWELKNGTEKKKLKGQKVTTQNLGPTVEKNSIRRGNNIITFCHPTEDNLKKIVDYMLGVFKCPVKCLDIDLRLFPSLDLNWKSFKSCEKLTIECVEAEEANIVISHVDGLQAFEVKCENGEVDLEKLSSISSLHIGNAPGMTKDQLFSLQCGTIEIGANAFPGSIRDEILGKWLNREWETLSSISIQLDGTFSNFPNIMEKFHGVLQHQFNYRARHLFFKKSETTAIQLRGTVDVRRTDGRLATLTHMNGNFMMFVWPEVVPNLSLPNGMCYAKITVSHEVVVKQESEVKEENRVDVEMMYILLVRQAMYFADDDDFMDNFRNFILEHRPEQQHLYLE
ncbi:Protein CBG16225 [Caenorhabditis briggsae]|nr:Protein CBG16225 [Caenorhabditis briggsae]ULT79899.1 hypothetical protein L3Y34_010475 [Caenorhabditis briggsae]CAP34188.1 Protein CBG16225 [Caenorhabditis briggsae]